MSHSIPTLSRGLALPAKSIFTLAIQAQGPDGAASDDQTASCMSITQVTAAGAVFTFLSAAPKTFLTIVMLEWRYQITAQASRFSAVLATFSAFGKCTCRT
jgi:hypothetical protein